MLATVERRRLLVPVPFALAEIASHDLRFLPNPPLTPDQVELLKPTTSSPPRPTSKAARSKRWASYPIQSRPWCRTIFGASAKPASSPAAWRERLSRSAFVFERQCDAGAEGGHFALVHLHVHLGDLGNPQVTQRTGCRFDGDASGIFPGFFTDADDVDNPVDAIRFFLRHCIDPFAVKICGRDRKPRPVPQA